MITRWEQKENGSWKGYIRFTKEDNTQSIETTETNNDNSSWYNPFSWFW